jgi:hypothetical protein
VIRQGFVEQSIVDALAGTGDLIMTRYRPDGLSDFACRATRAVV